MLKYNPNLKQTARRLRNEMTHCERILWVRLRRKQLQDAQREIGGGGGWFATSGFRASAE